MSFFALVSACLQLVLSMLHAAFTFEGNCCEPHRTFEGVVSWMLAVHTCCILLRRAHQSVTACVAIDWNGSSSNLRRIHLLGVQMYIVSASTHVRHRGRSVSSVTVRHFVKSFSY